MGDGTATSENEAASEDAAGASGDGSGTGAETIAAMFLEASSRHEGTALTWPEGDSWKELSYAELGTRVREIAKGLIALGIEAGDRVAIFSETRPEWTLTDFGSACAGAVVASIYHTSSEEEARHVLESSGARLVFCEGGKPRRRIDSIREEISSIEHVVLLDSEGDDEAMSLDDLVERGSEADDGQVDERVESIGADDLFTLIYTSGTTGPPKGCMLTNANFRSNARMVIDALEPGEDPVFYVFLPLAHTLTRMVQMLAVDVGATLAYWGRDKEKMMEELKQVRPTHFPAVPRIFEKIYNEALSHVPDQGAKAKLFEKGIEAGRKARERESEGKSPGPLLKLGRALAENELLSDIRELFGGRLRFAMTGAAPVAEDMLDFFFASGVLVLEGYGATETSAVASTNTPEAFRFGTVGKPLEGTEVKIDEEEGEVLVRGPHVFQGYYGDEEATSEALDDDGWLHTGDTGSLDDDGYLTIDGRIKDIIVTSSGKNVSAANIENRIAESRWISYAVLYGDEKPYLVAAVTIDEDERASLAERAGVPKHDPARMARDENVRAEVKKVIDAANEEFADIEQVKEFVILDADLSESEGEVTPTMKVKREVVHENHREVFEALYEEGGASQEDGEGDEQDDGGG